MGKLVIILLVCIGIIVKVRSDFIQIIPHRNNRETMIDSVPKNGDSNRISKTFEDILKNMNVSIMDFQDINSPEKRVIKILLRGSIEETKQISREDLMDSLWVLDKINIPTEKQLVLWNLLKGEDQINELTRTDLEKLIGLFTTISEMDLININVTNDDILDFLGTYKNFTNRQLGILAFSLRVENATTNIPQNIQFVNRIKGLLCGFGETHLSIIHPENFKLINKSVFNNLWGCNKKQLQTLLEIAQDPHAFGPILTWPKKIVSKLGFVITAMEPEKLKEISPKSFEDISPEVVGKFETEQIGALTKDQVKSLKNEAHAIYQFAMKSKNYYESGKDRHHGQILGAIISVLIFTVI